MNVTDYYSGKIILLTGCTGFLGITHLWHNLLGKVVLEKMLRSLPKIKKIYLLIRPKVMTSQ